MTGNIIAAVVSLGLMGLAFGAILAFASKAFAVEVDERVPQIADALPGANCGGCGFAGCNAFASAVVEGNAPVTGCPVGDADMVAAIAAIMGVEAEQGLKQVANVHCAGSCTTAKTKYDYIGLSDCDSVMRLGGGDKQCRYGCIGLGSCVKACKFDALTIVNGVAVVDREKCTACSMCVTACPKKVISFLPYIRTVFVQCASRDKGGEARKMCDVSCIGCKICEKNCPNNAIKVENNIALIDYNACTSCGICVQKCPRKCIFDLNAQTMEEAVQPKAEKPAPAAKEAAPAAKEAAPAAQEGEPAPVSKAAATEGEGQEQA